MLPLQVSPSPLSDEDAILWSPTSYPLCNIPGHHSDSTFHTHDNSASTTFARIDRHDDAALAPASLSSPDVPSSSVPASLHVPKSLTDVPPLGDFHPDHQTITESLRTPVTSQDPAAAGAILDTSGVTIPGPTPETLTSIPPLSSTPAAVSLQHNADLLTPSGPPNLPSSASYNPVPTPYRFAAVFTLAHHSI
ncbi:hypothetical protein EDB84DRAFT_251588 [Lactarius hengduanensis]|nr:hypothetical protein EDB84DRAFT_251588 [Lactarius hengduanensis]